MVLPAEIGLYFDFNVTSDGIPHGCPGLDIFTSENFNKSNLDSLKKNIKIQAIVSNDLILGYLNQWSTLEDEKGHRFRSDPLCGLNKLELPKGSTPLHQIFEEYAAENQKWIEDFIPAFEKMLSNGYAKYIFTTQIVLFYLLINNLLY